MRKIQVLRRFATLLISLCLLAACQTSPNNSASTVDTLSRSKKTESPRPLSTAGFAPVTAVDREAVTSAIPPGTPDRGSLTMETAVRRALGWHPAVDEASGKIFEADERIRAAQAGYYPKLEAGVNSGYRSNNRDGWRPQFSVGASQMLYDFGKVSSSVNAERAGKEINNARLLLTVDNLARDTANAVVEVQRFRSLSSLAQAQVTGVKKIAALVNERTDKGASTMSDKVQSDARVESAIATQLQYQSELSRWQVALGALLGGGAHNPASSVPSWLGKACDVAAPDWEEVPALLEAQAAKEEAKAQLAASRADAMPTVSLEATTGYDLNNSQNYTTGNDRQPEYSVGVNVSSSLYNGGQTGARKRAAAYALQAAEAAISTARYDIQRNLMESRSQIGTLNRLMHSLELRADMMVKTRDLYREQYVELGTRTLLDLLNSEQELHEARFQTANTVHDIRRLDISCLYNSGKTRQSFGLNPATLRASGGSL